MLEKNDDFVSMICFKWAKYSLGVSFKPMVMTRKYQMRIYDYKLYYSEALVEYRELCWKILLKLAENHKFESKLLLFLVDYSRNLNLDLDIKIINSETKYVESLLSKLMSKKIYFLKVVQILLFNAQKINIKYDEKFEFILEGEKWDLYKLLNDDFSVSELDYMEYHNDRKNKLEKFGKNLIISEIPDFIQNMNDIYMDIIDEHDKYFVKKGFETIIRQFDMEKNKAFLDSYIGYECDIPIYPSIVLKSILEDGKLKDILIKFKKMNLSQKNDWLYNLFYLLPNEQVNIQILEELYDFLNDDICDCTRKSCYRNIVILNKFMALEPNIYILVCSKLFEIRNKNGLVVDCYFAELFNEEEFSPEYLCELFTLNMSLLKQIYFYMLRRERRIDFRGHYLLHFISLDKEWIDEYTKLLCEHASAYNDCLSYQASSLWKSTRYIEVFNQVFNNILKTDQSTLLFKFVFKNLMKVSDENIVKQNQLIWLKQIIAENAFSDSIFLAFDFICELDVDVKVFAIKTFLNHNSNYDTFKKLSFSSSRWFGVGSLIPSYQKEIDFYKSLLPLLSGIDFIEHKKLVKEKIECLKKNIKNENINLITTMN